MFCVFTAGLNLCALFQAIMTVLKQLPVTEYARMIQWILKYAKNAKVCLRQSSCWVSVWGAHWHIEIWIVLLT